MAMPEMEEVKDLALKYPKNVLGRMAQMGQISSTLAVMAGMMRDRIVQSEMKPPTKTVAQEVLPADSMGMEGFSDPTAAQQPVMRRAGGLARIPVRDNMYEMAGGGIVAFQAGGQSPSFTSALAGEIPADPRYLRALQAARGEKMPRKDLVELMTIPELQEFNRTGAIPERLSAQVQGRMIESIPAFDAGTYGPEVTAPFVGKTSEQVDQFSGTQTSGGAMSQTDPGAVLGDRTPSTAMLKKARTPTSAPAPTIQDAPAAAALAASASAPPPVAETPLTTEQQIQKRLELEQRILGTDPRTAAMQAALERSTKVSEADRILDSLRIISAGAELEKQGTTKQLEETLSSREKAKQRKLDAELKKAEIEGRDYERKARVLGDVLGEERERTKTKEERAFQTQQLEKQLLSRENLSKEEIKSRKEVARIAADSRPEQVMSKLFDLFRNGTPADKEAVSAFITLQGKGDLLSRLGGAGGPDVKSAIAKYGIEPTR